MMSWLDDMADFYGPEMCELMTIGSSFEGRELKVLKVREKNYSILSRK